METYDYLTINFPASLGIFFLLVMLFHNDRIVRKIKITFYVLILMEFIEMVAYSLELYTSTFDEPTLWRTILSIVGYSLRPMILVMIL